MGRILTSRRTTRLCFLRPSFSALSLFVLEFAVVEDADDGAGRWGRILEQVEAALLGELRGGGGGHNAQLAAAVVNDADFVGTDRSFRRCSRVTRGGLRSLPLALRARTGGGCGPAGLAAGSC